jgi:hypothetical protein
MFKKVFLLFFVLGVLCPKLSEASILFPFKGEVDPMKKELLVEINSGGENPFVVQSTQVSEDLYNILINIDHLKTKFFDISTVLESSVELIRAKDNTIRSLSGNILSKYTLLNYKPMRELSGQFEIREQKIYINFLTLGNIFCKGFVRLFPPFEIELLIRLSGIDINDFLAFFVDRKKIVAHGYVDGDINISGRLRKMKLKGRLTSNDGAVNQLEYNRFILNAEGVYPKINISGSNVTQMDGFIFNLNGRINLSDKENLGKQIKAITREPLVSQDGQTLEWTLKRVSSDDKTGTTELKYLRRKKSTFDQMLEGGSGMFGIERKVEF